MTLLYRRVSACCLACVRYPNTPHGTETDALAGCLAHVKEGLIPSLLYERCNGTAPNHSTRQNMVSGKSWIGVWEGVAEA